MQTIFLDFENYYDTHYTLKKLSTSEFVRDTRFKAHGAAINDGGETFWLDADLLPAYFDTVDWSNTMVVAHHAHYDGLILSEHYGVYPKRYGCTLSLSRAVHQGICGNGLDEIGVHRGYGGKIEGLEATKGKLTLTETERNNLAKYCVNDVDKMIMFWNDTHADIPREEHDLIDMTIRMFTDPVLKVDKPRAAREMKREIARTKELIEKCGVPREVLSSNPKFAEYLKSIGVEPPTKVNAKGKVTWAFAKNDIAFQQLQVNPELRPIIKARLAVKSTITETRAQKMMEHCPEGKSLPIYLNYWGAHTGRWSGGDKLNPQNFTRGGELRKSILAPDGYQLVVLDLSQIEARMLAWWAECLQLVEAFAQGRDIYSEFASSVFGYEVNRKLKEIKDGVETYPFFTEGFVGKVCILGLGYGMGAPKFEYTLASGSMGASVDLAPGQAQYTVNLYRNTYVEIPQLWKRAQAMLAIMARPRGGNSSMFANTGPQEHEINGVKFTRDDEGGLSKLPSGRVLRYPDLWLNDKGDYVYRDGPKWKKIYGGLLVENIVQAMARDVIAKQMLQINERYRIVLSTHDECVFLAKDHEAKDAYDFGMDIMTQVPTWCPGLPLEAEGGWAKEYSK